MIPFPELGPLCPWETPDHADRYAAVDHAQHAFEEFQGHFADCSPLLAKGRMVLVSGGSKCGKTSLIHRCAHWLRDHPPADHRPMIIDLTRDHAKAGSIDDRMGEVWKRLLRELKFSGIFEKEELGLLGEETGGPLALAYETLSRLLQQKKWIFMLLLPQSTVPEELVRYGGLAAERNLLFFAETSYEDVAETSARQLYAAPPLRLRVGTLGAEDGWAYLSHFVPDGSGPTVSEETMRKVIQERNLGVQPMTVTELQRLMRGIWSYAAEHGRTDLTFDDFKTYAYRTAEYL
ncbi:hypothetical protein BKA00_006357 [Actinomadura coerulea]|uniref:ATP-binding protein n=1 Tax=Actinomadura coerulea TaxID=46159 RepID=A0A7X0G4T8_9ACTN|nr:hypothetical protein [Actinomadura coerulea]MBB6399443.1 hypothetical protein [Actinomadura coerulea]GGQ45445.1 hypothetical protein GCM10010187_74710 [Actinomadura coerulea]